MVPLMALWIPIVVSAAIVFVASSIMHMKRMVFGNKVIDLEIIYGVRETPIEGAAIYEVSDRGISRMWFVSA